MPLPDYRGGSIVNLMSSLLHGMGADSPYPPARDLPPGEIEESRHVVLLVVDGLGFEYLRGRPVGVLGRHLRGRLTSVFPSTTASAITAFLTGVAPQQHGLTGWFTWMREVGSVMTPLPFKPRVGGAPLGRLGVEPRAIFNQTPVFDRIHRRGHVLLPQRLADSDYSRAHGGGAERHGYARLSDCFRRIRKLLRGASEPTYVYAYWPTLDTLAHEHGISSSPVAARFDAFAAEFEHLVENLAGTRTALLVTADHGFVDTTAATRIQLDHHPALAETLMLPLCGEPRAAYCYVQPGLRTRFEHYVREELEHCASLHAGEELIEAGWFGLGQPHPRLRERVGHYVLVMKDNYALRDTLAGEHPNVHIGVHGGLSSAEMHVPLVVVKV